MKFIKYFFFASTIFFFTSCEDVIELDLESTEPQLVIEATLDAGKQVATVVISKTNDFYDNSPPKKISGANISLEGESGTIYSLQETLAGTYQVENINTTTGELFTIKIEVDGQLHEAASYVPQPISLDGILVTDAGELPFGGNEGETIMLSAQWNDPVDIENFYRIRTYEDSIFQPEIYTLVTDDFVGDGNDITLPIRDRYKENTQVTLELMSVDENYYDYFFQVSSLVGEGSNSTTPYNPTGNFGNNVLGYFGVFYSSTLTIEL